MGAPNPEAMIFDGAIDPKEYRMGPGDMLQMRLWTTGEPYSLMVSPENVLIVPRIGEFDVKGKTLDEVRTQIKERALEVFKGARDRAGFADGPVSLTLLQPRRIIVKVKGEVKQQSVFMLTAGNRADVAIEMANKSAVSNSPVIGNADLERQRLEYKKLRESNKMRPFLGNTTEDLSSLRYITVSHSDGTTDRMDLLRYNATHDSRFAPLLREGDVVNVPFTRTMTAAVGIYGAVQSPGLYEFVPGDSLWAMITAVYGPTLNADLSKVELTRMKGSGDDFTVQVVDAAAIRDHRASDIALQSGDRVFVRESIDVRPVARVIVKGEVLQPGVYPIRRSSSKLSEVIHDAGGFTSYAFLKGAAVLRKPLDYIDQDATPLEEALQVNRLANLGVEDTANFRLQSQLRDPVVTVDMYRLFHDGDSSADVTLSDGDVIYIPSTPNTVYVWGYVGKKGYITYKPGEKLDYYIAQAGGYAEGSVKSGTRIIKAQTRQWLEPDDTMIEPGDEIFVPKQGDYPQGYTLNLVTAIGYLLISAATLAITILRF